MNLFHRHHWRETQRVFTGPSGLTSLKQSTQETAERLIWGVATVVFDCEMCGMTRHDEIKGDARIGENIQRYALLPQADKTR